MGRMKEIGDRQADRQGDRQGKKGWRGAEVSLVHNLICGTVEG